MPRSRRPPSSSTLRTSAPVGPFGLIGRARSDLDRLKTVLESYGYYQSYVAITIDGSRSTIRHWVMS
jgi:translocation and assembly module TamA